jgi:hypothetical protein
MSDDFSSLDLGSAFATVGMDRTSYADMNKGIQPLFFIEELPDDAATEKAGTLKMAAHERVRLFTAGDMNSCPVHPVTPAIIERFHEAYAKWKATRSNDHIDGTPLAAWPLAGRGFVMELGALHIRSVEDLAGVADVNIAKISDGRIWREKAKAWLASNKDSAAAARFAAEAERLRDDNADLQRQLAELAGRVQAIEGDDDGGDGSPYSERPLRRGRPRRAA